MATARFWISLFGLQGLACATATPPPAAPPAPAAAAPAKPEVAVDPSVLRIVHTSDEHGWFEGRFSRSHAVRYGGAEVLSRYLDELGFSTEQDLLVSSGDSWTGPALSTLLEGQPMIDAFNALGYRAVAMGNHEFDFGLDVLKKNIARSKFHYLGANLDVGTTDLPIKPSQLIDVGGTKVGIVGLVFKHTKKVTFHSNTEGLKFTDYKEAALREAAALQKAGAELTVILMHDNATELAPVAAQLHDLGVRAVLGGHIYEPFEMVNEGVAFCVPYDRWRETCQVEIDRKSRAVKLVQRNPLGSRDNRIEAPKLVAIHTKAKALYAERGKEVLAHAVGPITRKGQSEANALGHLITLAWLRRVPEAAVAITNRGGVRADLQEGAVTVGDVIGLLPFNNNLVQVHLTGAQLKEVLAHPQSLCTGANLVNGAVQVAGQPIPPEARVAVLINDFMLHGGDNYRFKSYKSSPIMLQIPWRQPVFDYLRSLSKEELKLSAWALKKAWADHSLAR
jgi:2',3'-cyclic-nucleotide 2'-phosphodiesterase (5'-nucleotidase family)